MSLGSYDHQHDYPERGWQGKPVSPAGKHRRQRISNPCLLRTAVTVNV